MSKTASGGKTYRKNLNNWTVCYVIGHSSPSKVKIFFFSVSEGGEGPCFCCVFAPFPGKGILDFIATRPIIQVFTVCNAKERIGTREICRRKNIKAGVWADSYCGAKEFENFQSSKQG